MAPALSPGAWRQQDTTPAAVEAALRGLLARRHADNPDYVPARALNLVCIVDGDHREEILGRLRAAGRHTASRTIVCAVEPGRRRLDASAEIAADAEPAHGAPALVRETVVLSVGERHLPAIGQLVDPLVVTDLATVAWAPHGHDETLDALTTATAGARSIAQVALLDSVGDPEPRRALRRVDDLARRAAVVDLAWLRSTPWRERVAAVFDPPARRPELRRLRAVTVGARPGSEAAALLLLGWLCAQLRWTPAPLRDHGEHLAGGVRGPGGEVALRVTAAAAQQVPGLEHIALTTDDGTVTSLSRGTGGLIERRAHAGGPVRAWTVLGASRGEAGILGEGIRQALLRDRTYAPALCAARRLC